MNNESRCEIKKTSFLRYVAKLIFLFVILIPTSVFSQEKEVYYDEIFYDSRLSNKSTATMVGTSFHMILRPIDEAVPSPKFMLGMEKYSSVSSLGIAGRIVKFSLLELPLISYACTFQHELGHGFRLRDFDNKPEYSFSFPFPYNRFLRQKNPIGQTRTEDVNQYLSPVSRSLKTIGGLEANQVFSKYLLDNSLQNQEIDRPLSTIYFFAKLNAPLYGKVYRDSDAETDGDLEQASWAKNIRTKAWINALDLVVVNTIYKSATYFIDGDYKKDLPWIEIQQNISVLPGASYYLIPFGEAYELNFLSRIYEYGFRLDFARWDFIQNVKASYFKLKMMELYKNRGFGVDAEISFVDHQPDLVNEDWNNRQATAGLNLEGRYFVNSVLFLELLSSYKTSGYLPNYSIKKGSTFGAGVGLGNF